MGKKKRQKRILALEWDLVYWLNVWTSPYIGPQFNPTYEELVGDILLEMDRLHAEAE